jgi:hypothetical protein
MPAILGAKTVNRFSSMPFLAKLSYFYAINSPDSYRLFPLFCRLAVKSIDLA